MTNLAILGPGLLGGSISLAVRARGSHRVAMWARRSEAVDEVSRLGVADRASADLQAVVADADFVILCVPIGAMPGLARQVAEAIPHGTIVTDVGSVKAEVCAQLGPLFRDHGRFVGSHPMAGSDQTGLAAARADLFEGAVSIVTPDDSSDAEAVAAVSGFWQALGSRVLEVSPAEHDRIVAHISHLPHILAAALVNTVAAKRPDAFEYCGPGFRDTTRVAGGPPEMWTEILRTNRVAVREATEALIEKLGEIATLLERDQPMTEFLTQAKAQRDRLRLPKNPHA